MATEILVSSDSQFRDLGGRDIRAAISADPRRAIADATPLVPADDLANALELVAFAVERDGEAQRAPVLNQLGFEANDPTPSTDPGLVVATRFPRRVSPQRQRRKRNQRDTEKR